MSPRSHAWRGRARARLLAETGPRPHRDFLSAASFCARAGVCPGSNESAGKRPSGRARKGNRHLRVALAACAYGAAQSAGYYRSLTAHKGCKRAILVTAHKLRRPIYAVLRDNRRDRGPGIDYEQLQVQRNAPRWLAKLRNSGYLPAPTRTA